MKVFGETVDIIHTSGRWLLDLWHRTGKNKLLQIGIPVLVVALAGSLVSFHLYYMNPRSYSTKAPLQLAIPVKGVKALGHISPFGAGRLNHKHQGIDIFAKSGTPVIAPISGKIGRTGFNKDGAGNFLWMTTSSGEYGLLFCHLSETENSVVSGKWVKKGEVIGYVGKTGNARSTPNHLHFEVAKLHEPGVVPRGGRGITRVDPMPFLWKSEQRGFARSIETLNTKMMAGLWGKLRKEVWLLG